MTTEKWKKEALDLGGESFVEKISDLADSINLLVENAEASETRMEKAEMSIEKLYKAYPSGDVDGHRRYHELIIENTEEKRRLRLAIKEKTYAGLAWAAIVAAVLYTWGEVVDIIKDIAHR